MASAWPVPSNHLRIGAFYWPTDYWPSEFVQGLAFIAESDANKVESKQCPNGGTGRRARFRTWFSQGSGGSSPLSGTISIKARFRRILRQRLSAPPPVRFPILYLVSRTVFAIPDNSVIFLVAVWHASARQPGHGVSPLKQNCVGTRARIRFRDVIQEFSAQTHQTHRASSVSDLRHIVFDLRSCKSANLVSGLFAQSSLSGTSRTVEANFPVTLLMNYDVLFDSEARTMTLAAPGAVQHKGVRVPCRVNRKPVLSRLTARGLRTLSFSGQVHVAQDEQRGEDPQQEADFAPRAGRHLCERIADHAQT